MRQSHPNLQQSEEDRRVVLIRILVGFISAILKALATAFLAIFSSVALAITAIAVLIAVIFGICGVCGVGFFARNR